MWRPGTACPLTSGSSFQSTDRSRELRGRSARPNRWARTGQTGCRRSWQQAPFGATERGSWSATTGSCTTTTRPTPAPGGRPSRWVGTGREPRTSAARQCDLALSLDARVLRLSHSDGRANLRFGCPSRVSFRRRRTFLAVRQKGGSHRGKRCGPTTSRQVSCHNLALAVPCVTSHCGDDVVGGYDARPSGPANS